jgi:hypothetical protein
VGGTRPCARILWRGRGKAKGEDISAQIARRPRQLLPMLAVAAAGFAFVYLQLFMFPFTPVAAWGDQALFLLEARQLLGGLVLYRDVFEFNTPGAPAVYWALFKLFGVRAWIPDLMLVLLGVGLAALTLVISRKVIRGPAAYLPPLLFLTVAFHGMLDGTHHWYSTLAVTAALAIVIEHRTTPRLAAAGVLCGVAAWFTSTRGPAALLGLVVFLFWERARKEEGWRSFARRIGGLLAAFVLTALALNAYFVWKAGLQRFLYCTVVYVLRYYPTRPYNNLRAYMSFMPHIDPWSRVLEIPIWLFINGLVPLAYILFLVRNWREGKAGRVEPRESLMLVNLFGLFLFLGVAPSPGFYRLCSVSLPAFIILVWFARCPGRLERALWVLLCLGAGILFVAEPVMRQKHWRAELELPTGRTAYLDASSYEEFQWVWEHARPPDYLFGDPLICFALGLGDPAQVPYVTNAAYTRPEQVRDVIDGLEKHRVRFVTWYPSLNVYDSAEEDNLNPLRAYLRSHYHLVRLFGTSDEILELDN